MSGLDMAYGPVRMLHGWSLLQPRCLIFWVWGDVDRSADDSENIIIILVGRIVLSRPGSIPGQINGESLRETALS